MRAAVLTEPGEPLSIRDVPEPELPADGVLVETDACGVCRSDWHAWQGHWDWLGLSTAEGLILGHEPAGRVLEAGSDVTRVSEGDRVTVPFVIADGTCRFCQQGRGNICVDGLDLGFDERAQGAFAERFVIPRAEYNAIPLPSDLDPVAVASLGCRFGTAFYGLAHRADVEPGDWVAVHGCGGVGLSAVQVATALGGNVIAVDVKSGALSRASELGAVETVDAEDTERVPEAVRALSGGDGVEVSVDALGLTETCRNSIACLDSGGRQVQIGMTTDTEEGEIPLPVDEIVTKEIEFVGSQGIPPTRYDEILRMMQTNKLDPAAVVSETLALDDVSETLSRMSDFGTAGVPVIDEFG